MCRTLLYWKYAYWRTGSHWTNCCNVSRVSLQVVLIFRLLLKITVQGGTIWELSNFLNSLSLRRWANNKLKTINWSRVIESYCGMVKVACTCGVIKLQITIDSNADYVQDRNTTLCYIGKSLVQLYFDVVTSIERNIEVKNSSSVIWSVCPVPLYHS
jgi:hypothetical protein